VSDTAQIITADIVRRPNAIGLYIGYRGTVTITVAKI